MNGTEPQDPIPSFCMDHGKPAIRLDNVRDFVVGVDHQVPLLDGRPTTYVNLDNAATTPPLEPILDCFHHFLEWYSSVHRGSGFKSLLSTYFYEKCRRVVANFIGADLERHSLIFTQNATHSLNKLAARLALKPDDVVLTTMLEHHSNLLPWRKTGCKIEYANVSTADGSLDMADMEARVRRHAGHLALVTVSGASNVTGELPPIRKIARLVHEHGSRLCVDATQFVPRRALQMGALDDPERIDFAAFSAHKMYAPFGAGVLVGPHSVFETGDPDTVGGGTVEAVTLDKVIWSAPPERDEAGTPNVPGAVALACAIRVLESIGMENVAEHERDLTRRALEALTKMNGVTLYGSKDPAMRSDRLGVIPINVAGLNHGQLAAILGYEWGIGVRNGCFCAQPYVRHLLGITDQEMLGIIGKLEAGDHATVPGMVRISFGVYNNRDEVDRIIEALRAVLADGPRAKYSVDPQYHDYVPDTSTFDFDSYAPF